MTSDLIMRASTIRSEYGIEIDLKRGRLSVLCKVGKFANRGCCERLHGAVESIYDLTCCLRGIPLRAPAFFRVTGVAMADQGAGVKPKRAFGDLLAALLDALKDALVVLRPQTLFVTDAEMIRRIGVPDKIARAAIKVLDENPYSGFPKKSEVWGNRRYWPAVEIWFQKQQELETKPESGKSRLR
jgi:hypothetical protein